MIPVVKAAHKSGACKILHLFSAGLLHNKISMQDIGTDRSSVSISCRKSYYVTALSF